ncbi:hypothetical protein THSYN_09175 [Candidatus Thiodictyon syntrophicum]|jgi:formylglycine-generating enzyme required for sulfatase activity|uniref:NACHT domain-containing protein n=2 Tax=Candidatus Thiodictyon syntrophicum TaxID=1166950 RepID=A0A2K8U692_9GAMM|nr:hypothetical protein THSYN_09175 [Candidatus Thiodictyon syntrophicum]
MDRTSDTAMTGPIRLLHLSDIHFRAGTTWDREPVLRDLAAAIAREVADGLVPDLVAITGDIAQAGAPAEYALARDWLAGQLWPRLTPGRSKPLPRDPLLLVPGNHDVDRTRVTPTVQHVQDALLQGRSQPGIADLFADDDARALVLKRHAAYLAFYSDWLGQPQSLPWWERTITIRKTRLHCAGLDSAWMARGDADRGHLLLGLWQVNQTIDTGNAAGAHWRLALLHHPWDYLAEFDATEVKDRVQLHRDLLLRGHLHQVDSAQILRADRRRDCLELAAGCLYEHGSYPNAFQWIELQAAPKQVRVLYRAWVKGAWQVDGNQPGCPDGVVQFELAPVERQRPPAKRRSPPPADPTRYLQDLWDETATIAIRGLKTGRPEANRIPIADLFIELQASGAASAGASGGAAARTDKGGPADLGRQGAAPLHAALANRRLVIVGDPGCGKTTFLRWVAHCLTADRLGRPPGPRAAALHLGLGRARLPVLVRIADWLQFMERVQAQDLGPALVKGAEWLPEYLGAQAQDQCLGLDADAWRLLLRAGEVLILLDGLDEAPDLGRRRALVAVIESAARAYRDCPLVVTSRPAALREEVLLAGFAHTLIERLDPAAIARFLARWSAALFPDSAAQAQRHRRALAAALDSRPEIRRLARNAVMLTALAVLHWNDKRLPEQRAELYDSIVHWLIRAREDRAGRAPVQRCRRVLRDLAFAMQSDGRGRQVQVTRHWAAERIAQHFPAAGTGDPGAIERAEAFLLDEELDSGLIVRRGNQVRFWHLTFQEYLAAQALAGRADAERTAALLDSADGGTPALYRSEWRETVLLLGGVLHEQGGEKVEGLVAAVLDRLGPGSTLAEQARAAGLLGALVRDLDPFGYRPADPRYARCLAAALAVFEPEQADAIPLADRIAAADALAQAGDPRLDWAHPERWVELPGGRFRMGAQQQDAQAPGYDEKANKFEAPVHQVQVSGFAIARFPVTVAEFAEFLAEEDPDPGWWRAGGADEPVEPHDWEDQQAHPSRPVVGVSWYQAMAFCAWLTDRLARPQGAKGDPLLPEGRVVSLPSEAQWEYAARGGPGRRYPWGEEAPAARRANFDDTGVGDPSPVGVFPAGATPEGVLDLAGNVLEWCLDADDDGFYDRCQAQGVVIDPLAQGDGGSSRVLRGGAFVIRAWSLRSSFRFRFEPRNRDPLVGFRCVLAAPRQP